MNKLLLIVDPQNDFINGSLPVPGAADAMNNLADYLDSHNNDYTYIVITKDWHPVNHCSFTENGGEWPIHCLQQSDGADIWDKLNSSLKNCEEKVVILNKGNNPEKEEYSIIRNHESYYKLNDIILKNNISEIDICGIAGDVCVLNTLTDGISIYGKNMFNVLTEFSPSLDGGKLLNETIKEQLK